MAVSTQILRAVRQEISFCFPHSEAAHAAQDDMVGFHTPHPVILTKPAARAPGATARHPSAGDGKDLR